MKDEKVDEEIERLISGSIIKEVSDGDDTLGKDMQMICKEMTDDRNIFRFSDANKVVIGWDSLLGAIADRPKYDPKVKGRYEVARSFRKHYHVNRGAIRSGMAEKFKDLGGSLLAFRGALAWREAGIGNMEGEEKKHSALDRFKKG